MNYYNSNSRIIECNWREFCEGIDNIERENSYEWRYLNCRYRLLMLKKKVADVEVDDFKRTLSKIKKLHR